MMMNESKARAMPALCLSALHCEGIWEMICTAVVTVLMCALFPHQRERVMLIKESALRIG